MKPRYWGGAAAGLLAAWTAAAANLPGRPVASADGPLSLDKAQYSCSDLVSVRLDAPGWNPRPDRVDYIGGDAANPFSVATRQGRLSPYRLAETAPDSGVFAGSVALECSGSGEPRGGGPDSGVLPAAAEDAVTVSFRYRRDRSLVVSAPVRAGQGSTGFDRPQYRLGETARIRVRDRDMNRNPNWRDRLSLTAFSDTDKAGTRIFAIETSERSGEFEAELHLTGRDGSGGERLRCSPGDLVTAVYVDRTLPPPHQPGDELRVRATARIMLQAGDLGLARIE